VISGRDVFYDRNVTGYFTPSWSVLYKKWFENRQTIEEIVGGTSKQFLMFCAVFWWICIGMLTNVTCWIAAWVFYLFLICFFFTLWSLCYFFSRYEIWNSHMLACSPVASNCTQCTFIRWIAWKRWHSCFHTVLTAIGSLLFSFWFDVFISPKS
jgi:hypothetical protein